MSRWLLAITILIFFATILIFLTTNLAAADPNPKQPRPLIKGDVLWDQLTCSVPATDESLMTVVLRLNSDGGGCDGADGALVLQTTPSQGGFAFPAATADPSVPTATQAPSYCIEVVRDSGTPEPAPHGPFVPGLNPAAPDHDVGEICVE